MKFFYFLLCFVITFVGCSSQVPKDLKRYSNANYGLEFSYPKEFMPVDSSEYVKNEIVRIALSQNFYPKTNFGDADFSVFVSPSNSLEACLKSDAKKTEVINGITYYTNSLSDAAAGNLYDSKYFVTYKNNYCFEIRELLHTSRIENYEPGMVTAVDEEAVWKKLYGILQSVKIN